MGSTRIGKWVASTVGISLLLLAHAPWTHAQRPEPRGFQGPFPEGRRQTQSPPRTQAAPAQRGTEGPGRESRSQEFWTPPVGIPDVSGRKDYVIGKDDVLSVTVWGEQDLSRTVVVSTEGDFTYPLLGRVTADGRTLRELEQEIRAKLSDGYLVDPQVTIQVTEIRSKRIFLLGEIQRPGAYITAGGISLIQALSLAAGPSESAARELIIVRPPPNSNHDTPLLPEDAKGAQLIYIPLKALLEGDLTKNVTVETGDTIFIPRQEFFFVLGEVRSPGKYDLVKGQNVLKAITMAGGFTDKSAKKKIKITRFNAQGEKVEIPAKPEDTVLSDDIIFVPESFF